jgi:hypothetical protein
MKLFKVLPVYLLLTALVHPSTQAQTRPDEINFVRQGVQRMIFNEDQSIPLAKLEPAKIVGLTAMHPTSHYSDKHADVSIEADKLLVHSSQETQTSIWFGGFNPFATYTIDLASCAGEGEIGFEFSDATKREQFFVTVGFSKNLLTGAKLRVLRDSSVVNDASIAVNTESQKQMKGRIILQMLGSGLVLYLQDQGLPSVIGQSDFNTWMDLREKQYIRSFQSSLYLHLNEGQVAVNKVEMALTTGMGLADIRPITYENGDPMLDKGRLWYTMSIRGRALPHHIQGVFSLNPTVFDLKLEGVILYDRNDGLLRNEIASHLFYDRKNNVWRGLTTGFSVPMPTRTRKRSNCLPLRARGIPALVFL